MEAIASMAFINYLSLTKKQEEIYGIKQIPPVNLEGFI
jgi:hypothetical protein